MSAADSLSRYRFKGMDFTLEFRVSSIFPEPFEVISLSFGHFLIRWCAEPFNQPCRLVVQVNIIGHGFSFQFVSTPCILGSNPGICDPNL